MRYEQDVKWIGMTLRCDVCEVEAYFEGTENSVRKTVPDAGWRQIRPLDAGIYGPNNAVWDVCSQACMEKAAGESVARFYGSPK